MIELRDYAKGGVSGNPQRVEIRILGEIRKNSVGVNLGMGLNGLKHWPPKRKTGKGRLSL
jgi:hypothetical protein